MIKFLLRHKADQHIEDINGLDSCDKAKEKPRYAKIKDLQTDCKNSDLRKKFDKKNHENKSVLRNLRRGLKENFADLKDISPAKVGRRSSFAYKDPENNNRNDSIISNLLAVPVAGDVNPFAKPHMCTRET
jgi:hypothetical protein